MIPCAPRQIDGKEVGELNSTKYGIFWWHLDFISGEKPWTDDDGKPMVFQDLSDAHSFMCRLYQDPQYRTLGFQIRAV